MTRDFFSRLFLGGSFALLVCGCGGAGSDDVATAPASGVVTVKGQPKADLIVTFFPEAGGRPATGRTDAEGRFTLTTYNTGDGAPVGTNKATVKAGGNLAAVDPINGPPMPGQPGYDAWMKEQTQQVDAKYADAEKSGLVYTVPPEGKEDFKIEL